jgi:alkanesulfonate monooxygenase SsuD/methylene tetrahydromethanopterin reductase-like flavin-dependent oxidoreductase (luciferase family)
VTVRFSLFDWLDETGRVLGESYLVRNEPDRLARSADRMDVDGELSRGRLLVGSPATVRARLGSMLRQSQANYFLGAFFFGGLTLDEATHSLDLFAREVIPA